MLTSQLNSTPETEEHVPSTVLGHNAVMIKKTPSSPPFLRAQQGRWTIEIKQDASLDFRVFNSGRPVIPNYCKKNQPVLWTLVLLHNGLASRVMSAYPSLSD